MHYEYDETKNHKHTSSDDRHQPYAVLVLGTELVPHNPVALLNHCRRVLPPPNQDANPNSDTQYPADYIHRGFHTPSP
jgi:hypothetical protein